MDTITPTLHERRHDLDSLRAIAMLLGIVIHAILSFVPIPWPVQDTHQHEAYGLLFSYLHGFRMPLFFLLSGFFTAMLWRKRGLRSLLWHRFKRIFLPMIVAMITVLPVMYGIIAVSIFTGSNQRHAQVDISETENTFWNALKTGDLEAVKTNIENGTDLKSLDPVIYVPPLSIAAIHNQPEITALLIENGAAIDFQTQDGSTALHSAAFFGHPDVVKVLLEKGAKTNLINRYGQTIVQTMAVDWATTEFIINMVKIEKTQEELEAGRAQCAELFKQYIGDEPEAAAVSWMDTVRFLQTIPMFSHLWFLWFLCWLVAGFSVYAVIANLMQWKGFPSWLMMTPMCYLWLIPITLIAQWYMTQQAFGPDTSEGLIPLFHVLFYYAIFFGFGALYFDTHDNSGRLGQYYWLTLPIASFVIFPLGIEFMYGGFGIREWFDPSMHKPISNLMQVSFAWLMTFGLMGLSLNHFSGERYWMRYLSDSSYWLYITHLPLVFLAQIIVREWQIPSIIKLILIVAVVTGILLLCYQWFVRYTFIGRFLNGLRTKPGKKNLIAETGI